MGTRRVAGLTCNRLLIKVNYGTGKGTSGMDKSSSEADRMHMELKDKFVNSLRIKHVHIRAYLKNVPVHGLSDGLARAGAGWLPCAPPSGIGQKKIRMKPTGCASWPASNNRYACTSKSAFWLFSSWQTVRRQTNRIKLGILVGSMSGFRCVHCFDLKGKMKEDYFNCQGGPFQEDYFDCQGGPLQESIQSMCNKQLWGYSSCHLVEPFQEPNWLMRDDHHIVVHRQTLLHNVRKVPVKGAWLGLARTVCTHRVWPYIW